MARSLEHCRHPLCLSVSYFGTMPEVHDADQAPAAENVAPDDVVGQVLQSGIFPADVSLGPTPPPISPGGLVAGLLSGRVGNLGLQTLGPSSPDTRLRAWRSWGRSSPYTRLRARLLPSLQPFCTGISRYHRRTPVWLLRAPGCRRTCHRRRCRQLRARALIRARVTGHRPVGVRSHMWTISLGPSPVASRHRAFAKTDRSCSSIRYMEQ